MRRGARLGLVLRATCIVRTNDCVDFSIQFAVEVILNIGQSHGRNPTTSDAETSQFRVQ